MDLSSFFNAGMSVSGMALPLEFEIKEQNSARVLLTGARDVIVGEWRAPKRR